jgi:hypothetical protein
MTTNSLTLIPSRDAPILASPNLSRFTTDSVNGRGKETIGHQVPDHESPTVSAFFAGTLS